MEILIDGALQSLGFVEREIAERRGIHIAEWFQCGAPSGVGGDKVLPDRIVERGAQRGDNSVRPRAPLAEAFALDVVRRAAGLDVSGGLDRLRWSAGPRKPRRLRQAVLESLKLIGVEVFEPRRTERRTQMAFDDAFDVRQIPSWLLLGPRLPRNVTFDVVIENVADGFLSGAWKRTGSPLGFGLGEGGLRRANRLIATQRRPLIGDEADIVGPAKLGFDVAGRLRQTDAGEPRAAARAPAIAECQALRDRAEIGLRPRRQPRAGGGGLKADFLCRSRHSHFQTLVQSAATFWEVFG